MARDKQTSGQRGDPRQTHLSVPLSGVAVASVIVALVSVTVLVIVTAIEDDSALNTVALSLAILAFVVQIIVYIAQASTANAQMLQGQRLYAEMLGVLTQIKERTAGTQEVVTRQFDTVLEYALTKAIPQTQAVEGLSSPEFIRELAENVATLIDPRDEPAHEPLADLLYPMPPPPDVRSQRLGILQTWPTEEQTTEVRDAWETLSDDALGALQMFATDEVGSLTGPQGGFGPGLLFPPGSPSELEGAGLVEDTVPRIERDGLRVKVLTDKGRQLARIFTAKGDPPESLADLRSSR